MSIIKKYVNRILDNKTHREKLFEFIDPFVGVIPDRNLNFRELTRAIRLALSAELEAIHVYESIVDSTDYQLAKTVLQEISDEEKKHVGELQRLLNIMLEDEENLLDSGASEVNDKLEEIENSSSSSDIEEIEEE